MNRSANTHIGDGSGPAALRDINAGDFAQSITHLLNLLVLDLLVMDYGDGGPDRGKRLRDARRGYRYVGKLRSGALVIALDLLLGELMRPALEDAQRRKMPRPLAGFNCAACDGAEVCALNTSIFR